MYQAKRAGRNCVRIADIDIELEHEPQARVESEKPVMVPMQVVQAFTAMARAHDLSTSAHAYRLVSMAEATARKLGFSSEKLYQIHLGALLHDIGKVGVPDIILRKPGALTNEEWVEMRKHPEIGRQILDQVGGTFSQISDIVAAHHERWDGKGYPDGLSGENIPLGARIITVVDAYDAMTSRRVYREPMSIETARAELLRCSGQQFDPRVVEAFLSVLDEQHAESPLEAETANQ